ncbi:Permease of the drug/metabolite transporter (DMT) superfamily [Peptoclostridium litorale DSM 5388]|uniref:EamA domain-containing protein n=1 Tax=Peptoclostridium litorale DSM 5388 TaxID=1121324 RepID=A0A069RGM3_PEPLI|nr:DMT family transporter [Peptoclostridium litorale]KDR96174.1 hypothetical protein CLIT_4c00110 [Peptoclostridium litorale DSM 5388]SIO12945.1 Permease of the drug/metabolite transporter (DMT) superfamily [Peptoclostridium litorale DSM 5388]
MSANTVKVIVMLGVLFTSFSSILVRLSDAPALIVATYRLGFTVVLIAPVVLTRHRQELLKIRGKDLLLCLASGAFLALHFTTWFASLDYTSVASSTVLVDTHAIFVVAGSYMFFRESTSMKALAYIITALLGSVIISLGDSAAGSNVIYGDFLAILGAAFVSGYMLIGRSVRKKFSVLPYTFLVYSSCMAVLLAMDFATKTPIWPYPKNELLIFFALAVLCTLLGHSLFNWSLEHISPTFVSTSLLSEPVFASIMAVGLLGEVPPFVTIAGGAVVIVGIYLFIREQAASGNV